MEGIEIPETCGVILLSECTLFPHGAFPLHIFEPRYREMLSDALGSHCMICVGTLVAPEDENLNACVAPVGTVGLIRASKELQDGRSNLLLHGICRVTFEEWKASRIYPTARIRPRLSRQFDMNETAPAVARLIDSVAAILQPLPGELKAQYEMILDTVGGDPSALSDCISQQFVQEPAVRRSLLEEADVGKRLQVLSLYLERRAPEN